MKKTSLAAGLLALAGMTSVGCKTTPKLAWWDNDKSADSAAIAHSAPTLPSDAARQAGGGPTVTVQTGDAPPYTAGAVAQASTASAPGSSYPTTDAPAFTPDVASRVASAPTGAPATSASLGTIAASPYNPSTPPPATTSSPGATTAPASTLASRYTAGASAPAYGSPAAGTGATGASAADAIPGLPPIGGVAGRYADAAGAAATTAVTSTLPTTPPGTGALTAAADRYNAAATAATDAATAAAGAATAATTAVAGTTQPYRPGGTGSYPTTTGVTTPQVRVATVPQDGSVPPTTSGSAVPPVARPGVTTLPATGGPTAPRYR